MAIAHEELNRRNVAALSPPLPPPAVTMRLYSEIKIGHGKSLLDRQSRDVYRDCAAPAGKAATIDPTSDCGQMNNG
jgi:hypothetical protein